MKKQTKLSELCDQMDRQYFEELDAENTTDLRPSAERIQQITFAKLREKERAEAVPAEKQGGEGQEENGENQETSSRKREGYRMKRKMSRMILVAAAVCLLGVTAFAATGGMEYFKSIFGGSVQSVEKNIWTPMVSASDDNYQMTLESMLTDGYKTDLILSVEGLKHDGLKGLSGEDIAGIFSPSFAVEGGGAGSYTCSELTEFSKGAKHYYHLEMFGLVSHENEKMTIALKKELAPIQVEVTLGGSVGAKSFDVASAAGKDQNYTAETVQLSPLAILVIGSEKHATGGIPSAQIDLKLKDGSVEELMSAQSFEQFEGEAIQGGGSMSIAGPGQEEPLVPQTMGARNPDGEVVTTGTFSRILNLNDVEAIIVDGTEFPVK